MAHIGETERAKCRHCQRDIINYGHTGWVHDTGWQSSTDHLCQNTSNKKAEPPPEGVLLAQIDVEIAYCKSKEGIIDYYEIGSWYRRKHMMLKTEGEGMIIAWRTREITTQLQKFKFWNSERRDKGKWRVWYEGRSL